MEGRYYQYECSRWIATYDEAGRTASFTTYNADGTIQEHSEYTYSDDGEMLKKTYNADGRLLSITRPAYGSNEPVTTYYNEDGSIRY